MRHTIIGSLLLLPVVLCGCSQEAEPVPIPAEIITVEEPPLPTSPPPAQFEIAVEELPAVLITDVPEGDVLTGVDANGIEADVRLYGIDCPANGQEFYREATRYTASLTVGQYVRLRQMGTDDWGRHVAIVVLPDGSNLNELLLEAGYAHWFEEFAPSDNRLAYFQARAKREKLGIWASSEPVPPWEYGNVATNPASPKLSPQVPPRPQARQPVSAPPITARPPATRQAVQRPAPVNSRQASQEATVYVANSGSKYHRGGCQYLRSSSNAILLSQARAKYSPCSKCAPPH